MTKPTQDKETLRDIVRAAYLRGFNSVPSMAMILPDGTPAAHWAGLDAAIATMFERLRTDLDMAVDLIQEAKGYEGPSGGPVTDHLDAAETHIDRVLTAFQQENSDAD